MQRFNALQTCTAPSCDRRSARCRSCSARWLRGAFRAGEGVGCATRALRAAAPCSAHADSTPQLHLCARGGMLAPVLA